LERAVPDGRRRLQACDAALAGVREGLRALDAALAGFRAWREDVRATREERDEHALLREFVERRDEIELAPPLIEARVGLARAMSALEGSLSMVAADTEVLPGRGLPRLRRALELARNDVLEQLAALEAWIPMVDGAPALRAETFHDVEEDARGRDVLAARVLLPNEFLGRYYHPQLESAVFLSATTWIQGGFESAMGYLGLDRSAEPAPDEVRAACRVRSFRAPEVFDYGRVLVGVPKDAPEPRQKEAWLAFVRRFVAHLGERTRGRMLVLFTNAEELKRVGEGLAGHFRARHVPLWWQGMPGVAKEELPRLFRARTDSVLMGLDTFWFGADFPGETLEYLVIARLPYGVPDRYHHAQCAALGSGPQRKRIYMPRALAKLRQGFGRLMRRVDDRGCVFLLDRRVLDPRHRAFLREMPLANGVEGMSGQASEGARLVVAPTDEVVRAGLAHMGMLTDVRRRGLESDFDPEAAGVREQLPTWELPRRRVEPEMLDIPPGDVPF
ncbi:MAG TPA: helicase C-terminal domain-containing protein, partial [Planctomycetota bacterium]|nr:helicase C-terminal domain-containing protein [Planctomycetota bacterium]